jgi:hypothetical protein
MSSPLENGGGRPRFWKQLVTNLKVRARLRRQQTAKARGHRLKYVTSEQLAYSDLLDIGVTVGRYCLVGTFLLYIFGLTTPKVPLADLPAVWSMPVATYLQSAGVGTGWSWVKLVGYGDYLNFSGIGLLCGLTVVCCLRVLPFSLQRKNFVFSTILILEMIVLAFAASGLLVASH